MIKLTRKDGTYSRTQMVNTLTAMVAGILTTMPGIREQIPEEAYGVALMVLTVVHAYLRATTTQSLK